MFIDAFVEPGTDPTLLMVINFVILLHIIAFVGYWVLLGRDLFVGTDSAYPYKNLTKVEGKKTQ